MLNDYKSSTKGGTHCVPIMSENIELCQYHSSTEAENELHFLFPGNLRNCLMKLKMKHFGNIPWHDREDPLGCKKLD